MISRFLLTLLTVGCLLPAAAGDCLIAIDAGHSRDDGGAISARGVPEWQFNAVLAQKLLLSLQTQGIAAIQINPAGAAITLRDRTDTAARAGASLLVSLHHDAVQPHYLSEWVYEGEKRLYSDHFRGYSLFVSAGNLQYPESIRVAEKIADGMLAQRVTPTLHHAEAIPGEARPLLDAQRGIYRFDDLVVLKAASSAAVLVEGGVIVNREEETRVSTPAYLKKLIGALTNAVSEHCQRTQVNSADMTR